MRSIQLKLCLALIVIQSPLLMAGTYRETVERSFAMPYGSELILENSNGDVTIESWDREEVWVEAIKEVRAGDSDFAEELLEKMIVDFTKDDDVLRIDTRLPRRSDGGFWDSLFGRGHDMKVTYTVKVPHRFNLDIRTVNGRVTANEVLGKQSYASTNGQIRVEDAGGALQAKTTNGSIQADVRRVDRDADMSFRTTNGSIEVRFPAGFQADIDARTTNGSVKTDFPIEVRGEVSKRKLRGKINGGGGRVSLHTTNGGIRILER